MPVFQQHHRLSCSLWLVVALGDGCGLGWAAAGKAKPQPFGYRAISGGTISTLLPPDGKQAPVTVPDFAMRVLPVTHAEFAQFTQKQPQWRRSRVARSLGGRSQHNRVHQR